MFSDCRPLISSSCRGWLAAIIVASDIQGPPCIQCTGIIYILNDAIFLSGCLSVSTGIAKSLPVVNFDDTFLKRAHALIFSYN